MARKLPPDKQVGQNLWKMRLRADVTQEDLAHAMGLYREAISDLERGERRLTLPEAYIAAVFLGCSMGRLTKDLPNRPV